MFAATLILRHAYRHIHAEKRACRTCTGTGAFQLQDVRHELFSQVLVKKPGNLLECFLRFRRVRVAVVLRMGFSFVDL